MASEPSTIYGNCDELKEKYELQMEMTQHLKKLVASYEKQLGISDERKKKA